MVSTAGDAQRWRCLVNRDFAYITDVKFISETFAKIGGGKGVDYGHEEVRAFGAHGFA